MSENVGSRFLVGVGCVMWLTDTSKKNPTPRSPAPIRGARYIHTGEVVIYVCTIWL